MNDTNYLISKNIAHIKAQIDSACERSGRCKEEITLIAVSKTKPVSLMKEAYAAGCRDFGENRVQELTEKYDQMPKDVKWHLIGHLQRNKVRFIIDKVALIHSVDSLRLAEEINKEASKINRIISILLEVNIAEETSKFGTTGEDAVTLAENVAKLPFIKIQGLMTVAPYVEKQEENREYFAKLRQLHVDIRKKNIDNVSMNVLSMGMSGDYQTAIEEGATCIRVGTGIFGDRHYEN